MDIGLDTEAVEAEFGTKIKSGKAKEDAEIMIEANDQTGALEITAKDVYVNTKSTEGLDDQEFCAMLRLKNDVGEEIDTTGAFCTYEKSKDSEGKTQTKIIIEGLDEQSKFAVESYGSAEFFDDAFKTTSDSVALKKFEEKEEPEVNFDVEFN